MPSGANTPSAGQERIEQGDAHPLEAGVRRPSAAGTSTRSGAPTPRPGSRSRRRRRRRSPGTVRRSPSSKSIQPIAKSTAGSPAVRSPRSMTALISPSCTITFAVCRSPCNHTGSPVHSLDGDEFLPARPHHRRVDQCAESFQGALEPRSRLGRRAAAIRVVGRVGWRRDVAARRGTLRDGAPRGSGRRGATSAATSPSNHGHTLHFHGYSPLGSPKRTGAGMAIGSRGASSGNHRCSLTTRSAPSWRRGTRIVSGLGSGPSRRKMTLSQPLATLVSAPHGEIRVLVEEQPANEIVGDVELGGGHVLHRHGDQSVSKSGRCSRRLSLENTSIGFSFGSRMPRCRIRIWVCWLYSTSVTAQPSRPARAVRPERCR